MAQRLHVLLNKTKEDMQMFLDFNHFTESEYNFKEENDKYIFETDIPGYSKDKIDVELKGRLLCISAESEARHNIRRKYDISNLDIKDIEATYESGVLKLNISKNKGAIKTIKIH